MRWDGAALLESLSLRLSLRAGRLVGAAIDVTAGKQLRCAPSPPVHQRSMGSTARLHWEPPVCTA